VLYRLAQEGLNNVVRHARASEAEVRLQWTPEQVTLSITDNGQGFDPAAVPPGHFGIGFMKERADALGAALSIASSPGAGTTVSIVWMG
jgi:signal transduction histidine kinase